MTHSILSCMPTFPIMAPGVLKVHWILWQPALPFTTQEPLTYFRCSESGVHIRVECSVMLHKEVWEGMDYTYIQSRKLLFSAFTMYWHWYTTSATPISIKQLFFTCIDILFHKKQTKVKHSIDYSEETMRNNRDFSAYSFMHLSFDVE